MYKQEAMQELKNLLTMSFPGEIERVVLYGSQVKGTAGEFSDYDVLVVVNHAYDWRFKHKIYDTAWEIDFKHDILTDVKVISTRELQLIRGKQAFIRKALDTGVTL